MKIIAVTQARTGSTRLPNKVLLKINGKSILQIHLERLKRSKKIDQLIVATTTKAIDDQICKEAADLNVTCFKGSEADLLDRYYQAVRILKPDYVVRITSDCPLIDPDLLDEIVDFTIQNRADYGTNNFLEHFPVGLDVEVIKFSALNKAWKEATLPSDREHVTPYLKKNSNFENKKIFKAVNYDLDSNLGYIRMTLDEKEDYEFLKRLIQEVGDDKGWKEYVEFLHKNKDLLKINQHIQRNEGYFKSLKDEGEGRSL